MSDGRILNPSYVTLMLGSVGWPRGSFDLSVPTQVSCAQLLGEVISGLRVSAVAVARPTCLGSVLFSARAGVANPWGVLFF